MARQFPKSISTICAAAALSLAGAIGASAATLSPEMQAVAKAADKEGEVTLVWASSLLGGANGAKRIESEMNAMFGTKVKVNYSPGKPMVALGYQILQEYKAKRPAASDVFIAPYQMATVLTNEELFHQVPWQKLLPGRIDDRMVEEKGALLRWVSYSHGVLYNTKMLPEPPRALKGYLDPKFKGKLATTPYAAGFDMLAGDDFYGPDGALQYAKDLSAQVSGLIRCNEEHRIASGEFLAFLIDCGGGSTRELINKGAPVARALMTDFSQITFFYLSVPKNAEHPNAAQLVSAYLLTPEGQKLTWETYGLDLHYYPSSHMREEFAQIEQNRGKMIVVTTDWYRKVKDGEKLREEVVELFRTKSK